MVSILYPASRKSGSWVPEFSCVKMGTRISCISRWLPEFSSVQISVPQILVIPDFFKKHNRYPKLPELCVQKSARQNQSSFFRTDFCRQNDGILFCAEIKFSPCRNSAPKILVVGYRNFLLCENWYPKFLQLVSGIFFCSDISTSNSCSWLPDF